MPKCHSGRPSRSVTSASSVGAVVETRGLAVWPCRPASDGIRVGRPVPGQRVGEDHGTDQIFVVLDADDAVEVLGTDEPVVGARRRRNPATALGKCGSEDDGILAVVAVVVADPELLRPSARRRPRPGSGSSWSGALAGHAQQDPPAAARAEPAGRAAVHRRHAGQQLQPPLLLAVSVQDDAGGPALAVRHGRRRPRSRRRRPRRRPAAGQPRSKSVTGSGVS